MRSVFPRTDPPRSFFSSTIKSQLHFCLHFNISVDFVTSSVQKEPEAQRISMARKTPDISPFLNIHFWKRCGLLRTIVFWHVDVFSNVFPDQQGVSRTPVLVLTRASLLGFKFFGTGCSFVIYACSLPFPHLFTIVLNIHPRRSLKCSNQVQGTLTFQVYSVKSLESDIFQNRTSFLFVLSFASAGFICSFLLIRFLEG